MYAFIYFYLFIFAPKSYTTSMNLQNQVSLFNLAIKTQGFHQNIIGQISSNFPQNHVNYHFPMFDLAVKYVRVNRRSLF